MKKLFLFSFCMLLTKFVFAIPMIYALHINGINTSEFEANQNLKKLKEAANIDASTSLLKWDLIYNPTDTADDKHKYLTNLEDVLIQKAGEAMQMSINDAIQLYMLALGVDYQVGSPEYNALIPKTAKDIQEHFLGKNFDTIVNEFHQQIPPELSGVVNALKGHETLNYSTFNNYVLLLPHSQGNLYANELYDYLTTEEHYKPRQIQIFGVATPASQLKGSELLSSYIEMGAQNPNATDMFEYPIYPYVTSNVDMVINMLRVSVATTSGVLHEPLAGDIDISPNLDDPMGHNLVDVYLADAKSRHEIAKSINYIIATFINFMNPSNENSIPAPNMEIQMLKTKGDALVNESNEYVCIDGNCPINDGYYKKNEYTNKFMFLAYYFFDIDTGYKMLQSIDNPGRMMYIFSHPHNYWTYDWEAGVHSICDGTHSYPFTYAICKLEQVKSAYQYNYTYSTDNKDLTDVCHAIITNNMSSYMINRKCIIGGF